MKIFFGLTLMLLFSVCLQGQINLSKMVQENRVVKTDQNSLYYIDFSATWCGPCVHVSRYLSLLQEQNPNQFYIMSLFNEPVQKVRKLLENETIQFAVAIDFEGRTFEKYKVRALPYGVLLNAEGDVVWKGKAADLTDDKVKHYLTLNKTLVATDSILKVKDENVPVIAKNYIPRNNIELVVENDVEDYFNVLYRTGFKKIQGKLSAVLAYYFQLHNKQVLLDNALNRNCTLYVKNEVGKQEVINYLLDYFNLQKTRLIGFGDVLNLNFTSDSKFWDCSQINWGKESPRVLIGDTKIKADNIGFGELFYYLANALDKPVVVSSSISMESLHDWEIHYKYLDLMKQQLWDNYSIKIVEKERVFPIYKIEKKPSK